jgi:DNA-binding response OmpR family regulator
MTTPVLCIDGNSESLELLILALAQRGVKAEICVDAESGFDRMRSGSYQAIVLGYYIPGRSRPEL